MIGVVVMAYGSPATPADIGAYYTHIRRGRPPTEDQLRSLARRYEAIGGPGGLTAATAQQGAVLGRALGDGWVVAIGYKHAPPFVEDAVAELAAAGAAQVVGVVMAPHDSGPGTGEYVRRLTAATDAAGLRSAALRAWHDLPAWLDFQAEAVRAARARLPARTKVLFTAHSLPAAALAPEDSYPDELAASARAVAERVGLDRWAGWGVAWQSAGRTDDAWLTPALLDVLDDLAATGRADGVLVCPLGFTSEHLEVRYDLDIEARQRAERAGLAFARTATPGADPGVLGALAHRLAALADAASTSSERGSAAERSRS